MILAGVWKKVAGEYLALSPSTVTLLMISASRLKRRGLLLTDKLHMAANSEIKLDFHAHEDSTSEPPLLLFRLCTESTCKTMTDGDGK